ncbi:MAG: hotdog domain-containing protein [Desulfobacterales bacterium]
MNFLKPAYGDTLVCRFQVIREGRRVIVSESEVFDIRDKDEILEAKALVIPMAVHREKITEPK